MRDSNERRDLYSEKIALLSTWGVEILASQGILQSLFVSSHRTLALSHSRTLSLSLSLALIAVPAFPFLQTRSGSMRKNTNITASSYYGGQVVSFWDQLKTVQSVQRNSSWKLGSSALSTSPAHCSSGPRSFRSHWSYLAEQRGGSKRTSSAEIESERQQDLQLNKATWTRDYEGLLSQGSGY